jgi:hypothetical protein
MFCPYGNSRYNINTNARRRTERHRKANMKTPLIVALAITLCGCVSTREVYTPLGSMVYAINCHVKSLDACMEEAGTLCGTLGYKVVSLDGNPPPAATPAAAGATPALTPASASAPDAGKPDSGIKFDRKIYIRCGA